MSQANQTEVVNTVREGLKRADKALADVLNEIAELNAKREKLQSDLVEWRRAEAFLTAQFNSPADTTIHTPEMEDGDQEPLPFWELAKTILFIAEEPLKTQEILDRMAERGDVPPEYQLTKFNSVYSAMLRRKHVFVNLGNGVWDLVERQKRKK